ncbi:hypothetical protein ACNVED_16220 (plasmid) [Legionella sp. D16C41]|uniref:hypothetical protein n=1 Tax=Legionella sp. D16C41 TaxID=3402688 RepID=UPI003AF8AE10
MKLTTNELDLFQNFLLETIYTYNDVHKIQEQLHSAIQNPVLLNWVNSLNLEMLEVASRMLQHWGKKA